MQIDHNFLLSYLKKCKKGELLQYLEWAMDLMTMAQLHDLFGPLLVEQTIKPLRPEQVLEAIRTFHADSFAGVYYAPFDINSKNFMDIPPETDMWFRDISMWLDRACELVRENPSDTARQCLELCMELVGAMNDGEDIIFADEYGDWMITAEYDYREIYRRIQEKEK